MQLSHQSEKYAENVNQSVIVFHYFVMSWKKLSCSFVNNNVYDNCNQVSYLQRN